MLAVTKPVAVALSRRCDAWLLRLDKLSFEREGDASAKTQMLQTVRDCYHKSVATHLKPATDRRTAWLSALKRQHGDRFGTVELVAESRLLLHLGRANVLENVGLCADRTTGLPIIPGTALKGVVSTWACWADHFHAADGSFREFTAESVRRLNFTATEAQLARQILGDDSASGSKRAGDVIFVGGFPLTPPQLGLDIVNPHHEPNGTEKARLTPNAFLCLEADTRWRFAFLVRPGAPNPADLLDQTTRWVAEALTQLGIGAKTASGYGRFRLPNDADRAAQARQTEQAKATEARTAAAAKAAAEKAQQQAAAQVTLQSDYPNPATFRSRVIDKLNPGQLDRLELEIAILRKPENQAQCRELQELLTGKHYRDIRKRLRDKSWFPKEWLPPQ